MSNTQLLINQLQDVSTQTQEFLYCYLDLEHIFPFCMYVLWVYRSVLLSPHMSEFLNKKDCYTVHQQLWV